MFKFAILAFTCQAIKISDPTQAVSQSNPACTSLGCKYDTAAPHAKKPDHPVDYPVADFGMDKDITASLKHMGD